MNTWPTNHLSKYLIILPSSSLTVVVPRCSYLFFFVYCRLLPLTSDPLSDIPSHRLPPASEIESRNVNLVSCGSATVNQGNPPLSLAGYFNALRANVGSTKLAL